MGGEIPPHGTAREATVELEKESFDDRASRFKTPTKGKLSTVKEEVHTDVKEAFKFSSSLGIAVEDTMTKLKQMSSVVGELGGESEMGTLVSELEELKEVCEQLEYRVGRVESDVTFLMNKPAPKVSKEDLSDLSDLTLKLCNAIVDRVKAVQSLVSDAVTKVESLERTMRAGVGVDAGSVGGTVASTISGSTVTKSTPLESLFKTVRGMDATGRKVDKSVSIVDTEGEARRIDALEK